MFYVMIDCKQTQEYVFASRRLRGIRNGSRALSLADRVAGEKASAFGGATIRALGGVVIARFPGRPGAEEFQAAARRIYASFGADTEAVCYETEHAANFYADVLGPLLDLMRRKKEQPEGNMISRPGSLMAITCETSGRFPATGIVRAAPDQVVRVNDAERAKWILPGIDEEAQSLLAGWKPLLLPQTFEGVVGWSASESVTGQDLAGTSEQRLLALVLADVNGLGHLLPQLAADEAKFSDFTRALRDCLRDSLAAALNHVLAPAYVRFRQRQESDVGIPFRLLFLGGDDLCFAVTGAYALPLVRRLAEVFEQTSPAALAPLRAQPNASSIPARLTLSAGVVIAPYKYPILSFHRLAKDLESCAKSQGRAWGALLGGLPPPSLVDVHIVANDILGSLEQVRASAHQVWAGQQTALYGGPYLAPSGAGNPAADRFLPLTALLEAADSLSCIAARGKLNRLREILTRTEALTLYTEWFDHLGPEVRAWTKVCRTLRLPNDRQRLPVLGMPENNTPLLDALELVPFAALRAEWEGRTLCGQ